MRRPSESRDVVCVVVARRKFGEVIAHAAGWLVNRSTEAVELAEGEAEGSATRAMLVDNNTTT